VEIPNEDDANIVANEVTTLFQKKKKQEKHKRTMLEDNSIPIDDEEIFDLYETPLNCKRKKYNFFNDEESMVIFKYHSESYRYSMEIITTSINI